jgi:hypothetical protein
MMLSKPGGAETPSCAKGTVERSMIAAKTSPRVVPVKGGRPVVSS